jgi:transposase
MGFVARHTLPVDRGAYRKHQGPAFERLPIYVPDFDDPVQAALHDRLEALVGEMMRVKNRIKEQRAGEEDAAIMQKAKDLDREIDGVVNDLYGLTGEEIALVDDRPGDSPC